MKKTLKTTKIKKPVQQTKYTWDEYFDLSMFERRPINDVTIEKWAKEMQEFFRNHPDPRYLSEFYHTKNISKLEFFALCAKYPALGRTKALALQRIGENMHRRSVDQQANWAAVKHTLYRHDEDFAADDAHAATLKEGSQGSGPVHVYLGEVELTKEVPHKPKKEQE